MTRTRTFAAGATAAMLALTLAACSDDSDSSPTDTSSSSGSSSSQPPAPMKDRSSQVFDADRKPQVLGSATGTVDLGIGSAVAEGLTFEVTDVRAAKEATILRFQLTAREGTEHLGMEGRLWYEQPTLQVPGADTKMQVVTGTVAGEESEASEERCVCTSVRFAGPDPRSQTALYPPLPDGASEVEVTLPGLDPVTVPVSR